VGYEDPKVEVGVKVNAPTLQGVDGDREWYKEQDDKPFVGT